MKLIRNLSTLTALLAVTLMSLGTVSGCDKKEETTETVPLSNYAPKSGEPYQSTPTPDAPAIDQPVANQTSDPFGDVSIIAFGDQAYDGEPYKLTVKVENTSDREIKVKVDWDEEYSIDLIGGQTVDRNPDGPEQSTEVTIAPKSTLISTSTWNTPWPGAKPEFVNDVADAHEGMVNGIKIPIHYTVKVGDEAHSSYSRSDSKWIDLYMKQ